MKSKKKAIAIVLAAAVACGTLAGCDALTTTNVAKDYAQTIAEVDLSRSADFADGGKYAPYKELVSKTSIVKRDMVASYLSSGYSAQQQYNWTYADTFDTIAETLVSRQVFVQYAKVYLAENGDKEGNRYTVDGYKAAVGSLTGDAAEIEGLGYFLTPAERAKADYDLKVNINKTIDSSEQAFIDLAEGNDSSTVTVRTLPTGAETESADYYTENYGIYTGREDNQQLGEYEKLDGSTATTRKKAYVQFLASLLNNNLIEKGEDTSKFETTTYYALEKKSAYEGAIISKMGEKFEQETEDSITQESAEGQYRKDLASNKNSYGNENGQGDKSAFETALDGMSDTSFVLAPYNNDDYGFVINILLPFSDLQTQILGEFSSDLGDEKGNHYAARAMLLQALRATDQRETWFTGSEDYSFEGSEGAFTGSTPDAERKWLFFENSFNEPAEGETAKYDVLKNYYGKYTFNGSVEKTENDDGTTDYKIKAKPLTINDFLDEMKAYLAQAGVGVTVGAQYTEDFKKNYFTNENYYYTEDTVDADGTEHKKGDVNYDSFIYEEGKVTAFDGNDDAHYYDANQIFKKGTNENLALSVINELSFAYNTDTAGLNTYLGYTVSPYKTSYMSEFEYAAQKVVKNGAGSYAVVPTDYGWHIIYCTFSFRDAKDANTDAFKFTWRDDRKYEEGTFSYLYYESLKSTAVSSFTTNLQSDAIDTYIDDCSTVFEDRFADLKDLDNYTS